MSDSVPPHRRQPTRLPYPWDSPGKNTGVGSHFLLQCMKVKSESEVAQCLTLCDPHGLQPTRLLRPWDFPGKSTGVGCHCLLQHNIWCSTIPEFLIWRSNNRIILSPFKLLWFLFNLTYFWSHSWNKWTRVYFKWIDYCVTLPTSGVFCLMKEI